MKILDKAKILVGFESPFYSTFLLHLKFVKWDKDNVMGTDGVHIKYNPELIKDYSLPELVFILLHEIEHVSNKHVLKTRIRRRNLDKWNIACDYVVNANIKTLADKSPNVSMPKDALYDDKYKGMSVEQVYELLPKSVECPVWGLVNPSEQDEYKINSIITEAVTRAQNAGKLPLHVEESIDKLLDAKVPWYEVLKPFFRTPVKTTYTWSRPKRRYISENVYLPSVDEGKSGVVALFIDQSGSVSYEQYVEFMSEVADIILEIQPKLTYVLYVDSDIEKIQTFKQGDTPSVEDFARSGCGGTDFRPPFNYFAEEEITPDIAVYLTDGKGSFPEEPHYQTIWVINNDYISPPWGELIRLT